MQDCLCFTSVDQAMAAATPDASESSKLDTDYIHTRNDAETEALAKAERQKRNHCTG